MIRWSWIRVSCEEAYTVIEHLQGEPSLEGLQDMVGGYIEYVPTINLIDGVFELIVNEEGIMQDLPDNPVATDLMVVAFSPLQGDVVVCWDDGFMGDLQ